MGVVDGFLEPLETLSLDTAGFRWSAAIVLSLGSETNFSFAESVRSANWLALFVALT